jgi:hypothetical protein
VAEPAPPEAFDDVEELQRALEDMGNRRGPRGGNIPESNVAPTAQTCMNQTREDHLYVLQEMKIPNTTRTPCRISPFRAMPILRGRAIFASIISVGALLLLGVAGWHFCTAHTVDPDDLAKLKVGMDLPTASKIIGIPLCPTAKPDGTYFIGIRKHDRWCMVDLTFDSSHRIISIFHDH